MNEADPGSTLAELGTVSSSPGALRENRKTELHTPGHLECPACELSRLRMINPGTLADLTFREAAPIWYQAHAQHIGTGTRRNYLCNIRSLQPFFAALPLRAIHIGHFEQYQQMRSRGEGGLTAVGPSRVNHELNTVSQILDRAGLWAPMAPHYRPMRMPKPKVGCALTAEDEERLFRAAASNSRWKIAYCAALIMNNTAAGPNEIRHLRLRDVEIDPPTIHIVEGVKNDYRVRDLPLNEPAAWAMKQLLAIAKTKGVVLPEHYLMPHRAPDGLQGFDPSRPISTFRGAWEKLREAAGLPHLRMYDLRHNAITKLLEDGDVPERVVIDLAGHVSRAMLQRYSHIRMRAKREAVDSLGKKGPEALKRPTLMLLKK
jgi:site-specific recombinase XerD